MERERKEIENKLKTEQENELRAKEQELKEEIKLGKERKQELQKFIKLEQAEVRREQAEKQRKFLESIAQSVAATTTWTHNLAELTGAHKKKTDAVTAAVQESKEGKPSLRSIDKLIREGNTFDKKRAKQEDKEVNDYYHSRSND